MVAFHGINYVEIDKSYMTAKYQDFFGTKGIILPFNDPEFISFLKRYGVDLSVTQHTLLSDANVQFGLASITFWSLCIGAFCLGYLFGDK